MKQKKKQKFDRIREATEDNLTLTTGTEEDRLLGLDPLLDQAVGATVLDIGCHVGSIAEAFVRRHAILLHGVDLYRPGLRKARERLQGYSADTCFEHCDLAGGIKALRQALPALRDSYDIVLYLGMHHHLVHQMSIEQLDQFVDGLIDIAGTFCAVRTSSAKLLELHERFIERRFVLWAQHEKQSQPVGPLRIYRRCD